MRRSSRRATWMPAVLGIGAIALVVAGCGGNSDGSDAGSGSSVADAGGAELSKSELVDQYCQIRAASGKKIEQIDSPKDIKNLDEVGKSLIAYAAVTSSQVDQLSSLNPPADVQGDWDSLISNLQENQATLDKIIKKTRDGDSSALKDLQTEQPNGKETADLIEKLGLSTCDAAG